LATPSLPLLFDLFELNFLTIASVPPRTAYPKRFPVPRNTYIAPEVHNFEQRRRLRTAQDKTRKNHLKKTGFKSRLSLKARLNVITLLKDLNRLLIQNLISNNFNIQNNILI